MKDAKEDHKDYFSKSGVYAIIIVAVLILYNQYQISAISASLHVDTLGNKLGFLNLGSSGGDTDISKVDITQIQNTAQAVKLLFPIDKIKTTQDAIAIMVPTGTPDYGEAMGISFDDPVNSLAKMAKAQPALLNQIKDNEELFQRYINLAAEPRGVSCEYCCGIGPIGATKDGKSKCGCQHNPALLSLTMWLLQNTDYSDAEILRENMRWKTLFFPKNMVELATQVAGGDASVLENLPGMVGGC